MNKKARHIGKRKAGSSARKNYTPQNMKIHASQKKKIVLYFKEDTIDSEKLQSAVPSLTSRGENSTSISLKNGGGGGGESQERERKEKKRECERERKEKGKEE